MTRIGIVYPRRDALSPANWSGTPHGIGTGLRSQGVEVLGIGAIPTHMRRSLDAARSRLNHSDYMLRYNSPQNVERRTAQLRVEFLRHPGLDAVIAMGTDGYDLDSIVRGSVPSATYDDGTLVQFARHLQSDLSRSKFPDDQVAAWSKRQMTACRSATVCFVSTGWARSSIIEDYGVSPDRVVSVGIGHRPRSADEARDWSRPRFLFVGIDWERKNGAAVVDAFTEVRQQRPSASLDLVGIHPTMSFPGVRDHGLLRRENPTEQAALDTLYAKATAFVLPSRFDPAGIAYLEAASAALPVIATTEGGASQILGDAAVVVHPDDRTALVAAMQLLAHPDIAKERGRRGAAISAESTWSAVARRMLVELGLLEPGA